MNFDRCDRYDNHLRNQQLISCRHCHQRFCRFDRCQQHERSEHPAATSTSTTTTTTTTVGGGINLDTPLIGDTKYQKQKGYAAELRKNDSQIRDRTKNTRNWKRLNRKIEPGFTYGDLKRMLENVQATEVSAFKINLGFGCILYHVIERVFRYYYVSNNHFLFDKAFTISNHTDIVSLFDKIVSLDLGETYYLRRPTSGWVLAGLPNIQIRIMRMPDIPIGAGVTLPSYIKRSKSIIGLTHHKIKGHIYNDNLCLFRCLALHYGAKVGGLEEITKKYKKQLEKNNEPILRSRSKVRHCLMTWRKNSMWFCADHKKIAKSLITEFTEQKN